MTSSIAAPVGQLIRFRIPPWGYIVLGLVLLLAMGFAPPSFNIWIIYAATSVLILLGVTRPVFLVGAIVLVEVTVAAYPGTTLGVPITARHAVILISLGIIFLRGPFTLRDLSFGPSSAWVIILAGAFLILAVIATMNGFRPELAFESFRQYGFPFAAMLIVATTIRNRQDLKLAGVLAITIFALSSGASILQHYSNLGLPSPAIRGNGLRGSRSLGLNESPIQTANHLLIGFHFVWGFLVTYTLKTRVGLLYGVLFLITAGGWFFTYTRSLAMATAVALPATLPLLEKTVRKEILLVAFVVLPVFGFVMLKQTNRFTESVGQDSSAVSRIVLWQVGYQMASDFPVLGVGYNSFSKVAPRYIEGINLTDEQRELGSDFQLGDDTLVNTFPVHNDFLRVWLSFGTITLLVYVALIVVICVKAIKAGLMTDDPMLKGASIGCFAAVVGYVVNSVVHNSLDSTMSLWLLAGVSLALYKVAYAERAASDNGGV